MVIKLACNYKSSILDAFAKRKIPVILLAGSQCWQAGLGYRQKRLIYSDINRAVSSKIANHKGLTKELLKKCNIPLAPGALIKTFNEAKGVFEKLNKPLVVKPSQELQGKGITTNITNLKDFERAIKVALQFKGKIVIEEHLKGNDHRILIIGGQYVAGLKRLPPYVIGDGKNTIEKLIALENKKRGGDSRCIKEIKIDENTPLALKKQKFTFASIPKKNQKVFVRMTGNISSGGISIDVTKFVHPTIISLCKNIARYMDLDVVGIDIITTDITKSLSETGGKITEVNQNPDLGMHQKPYSGKGRNPAQILVDYLFPYPSRAWIPIFYKEKQIRDQKTLDKLLFTAVPKRVKQYKKQNSKKTVTIENPTLKLFNYLIDNLTKEITME
jgi:cyanophycin synthetase